MVVSACVHALSCYDGPRHARKEGFSVGVVAHVVIALDFRACSGRFEKQRLAA